MADPERPRIDRKLALASKSQEYRAGYVRALRDVALGLQEDRQELEDSEAAPQMEMAARFVLDLSVELQKQADGIES